MGRNRLDAGSIIGLDDIEPIGDDDDTTMGNSSHRWSHIWGVTIHQGHSVEHIVIDETTEDGDVVIWENGKLVKCHREADKKVFGVADYDEDNGESSPAIQGIFVIKVLGPVVEGDMLVTSADPGYAKASLQPSIGTVIAQSMEDFTGNRGIIKAMIRKF